TPDSVVRFGGRQVDGNELRSRARGRRGEQGGCDGIGTEGRLPPGGDRDRKPSHIGGDRGDLERRLRCTGKRAAECKVSPLSLLLAVVAASAQGGLVLVGVGLSQRRGAVAQRVGLGGDSRRLGPVVPRRTRDL